MPSAWASASRNAIAELKRARRVRLEGPWALAAGIGIALLAILAKALTVELVGDPGYILLLGAPVVAAWIGGTPAGLAAMLTTLIADLFLFVEPIGGLLPSDPDELLRLALYGLVATVTVALVGSLRAARDRLASALERTASLVDQVHERDVRLELVLEASQTGLWEWDPTSGQLTWSDAIVRQHGLEPGSAAPDYATYLEWIHPDDVGAFRDAIDAAMAGRNGFDLEFRILRRDGSVHWTRGSGRVFRDASGRPLQMVGTGQDITERRQLEDERDALLARERRAREIRDSFIDVISHELRTPITTIVGLSELLTRPGRASTDEGLGAALADVRAEADRLYRLVEDLLVLGRVEHGRLEMEAEPIELRRLIEHVVAREAAGLPEIAVSVEIDPYLPIVSGETTYIEQILRNLLSNAAKYTPAGTHVVVSAQAGDDRVAVRVLDDGPGIPPEAAAKAFELFYRDPGSARTVSGSGIGLFVCATLAEAMGGRTWCLARPEGGSEFGFELRTLDADDDHMRTHTAAVAGSTGSGLVSGTEPGSSR